MIKNELPDTYLDMEYDIRVLKSFLNEYCDELTDLLTSSDFHKLSTVERAEVEQEMAILVNALRTAKGAALSSLLWARTALNDLEAKESRGR